jgi:hypothetical protein
MAMYMASRLKGIGGRMPYSKTRNATTTMPIAWSSLPRGRRTATGVAIA